MNPYKSGLTVLSKLYEVTGQVPERVVDVGCGDMGWLRATHELGSPEVLGLDAQPPEAVPVENRVELIGAGRSHFTLPYLQVDLTQHFPEPDQKSLWRASDLVICVEVAEHLPEEHANTLLDLIALLAAKPEVMILWSAAVPGQGPYPPEGVEDPGGSWHHNEQQPAYWEEKFTQRGFEVWDDATDQVLEAANSDDVDPWYKNSLRVFIRS